MSNEKKRRNFGFYWI